jgi:arylsulfatase A-like enzyme
VIDAQVQQIDLFPTLCELAGANAADWVQGKSWVPLLDGSKEKLHEAIFMEVNNHAAYEPKRSVRTARYRYTKRFDALDGPVLANCDDSISKTQWYEAGAVEHGVEEEVLYDLMLDPNEADNRIDDPALAEVAQQMRDRLDTWMRETDDPMLGEPKNIMEGFVVNQPESYSPTDKPTAAKA